MQNTARHSADSRSSSIQTIRARILITLLPTASFQCHGTAQELLKPTSYQKWCMTGKRLCALSIKKKQHGKTSRGKTYADMKSVVTSTMMRRAHGQRRTHSTQGRRQL